MNNHVSKLTRQERATLERELGAILLEDMEGDKWETATWITLHADFVRLRVDQIIGRRGAVGGKRR